MSVLDDILSLTDQVEASLDEGDWLAAAELNDQRQQLLTSLFATRAPQDIAPETREVLREILARNEAAAARVRMERELVAARQQRVQQSAAAVRAYEDAAATAPPTG